MKHLMNMSILLCFFLFFFYSKNARWHHHSNRHHKHNHKLPKTVSPSPSPSPPSPSPPPTFNASDNVFDVRMLGAVGDGIVDDTEAFKRAWDTVCSQVESLWFLIHDSVHNLQWSLSSIGSLGNHNSRAFVSNVTVRDSVIKFSDNGVRIKTWQGGSGSVSGVKFSHIRMENVRNPIIIDQFYCLTRNCTNKTTDVHVSDVVYSNIKATYDARGPSMHFGCSDSVPFTNLTLSDIELLPSSGVFVLDPFCWNAYGDSETLTIPPVSCLLEGSPLSVLESDLGYC